MRLPEQRIKRRIKKMRFSLSVGVVLLGISVSGLAQQGMFKVKPSQGTERTKKSAPIATTGTAASSAASANAKALQSAERASPSSAAKKPAPALKPVKTKESRTPPINFNGKTTGRGRGMISQGPNPYQGRLKEKSK
jgi:hypothetical protein